MLSWIVGRVFRHLIGKLNEGDAAPVVRLFARDARFVFPGDSSFGGEYVGKREIATWFERFVSLRPHFTIHGVTTAGPPWNIRAAVRFSDRMPSYGYANEGVICLRMRWGRVIEDRTYLDTEKVAALDEQLEAAA